MRRASARDYTVNEKFNPHYPFFMAFSFIRQVKICKHKYGIAENKQKLPFYDPSTTSDYVIYGWSFMYITIVCYYVI